MFIFQKTFHLRLVRINCQSKLRVIPSENESVSIGQESNQSRREKNESVSDWLRKTTNLKKFD